MPCRTEKTAAASEIKSAAYSPADVLALFAAFQQQAGEALLFLKNLRTVGLYVQDAGDAEPRLLYRMRLAVPQVLSNWPLCLFVDGILSV